MATEPSAEITFEEAPGPKYDWSTIAEKLKAAPGSWATVFDRDRSTYYEAVRQGSIAALRREHGFEVRSSRNTREVDPESGKESRFCRLHLRYLPSLDTTVEQPTKRKRGK